jgi:hypothetical protein
LPDIIGGILEERNSVLEKEGALLVETAEREEREGNEQRTELKSVVRVKEGDKVALRPVPDGSTRGTTANTQIYP